MINKKLLPFTLTSHAAKIGVVALLLTPAAAFAGDWGNGSIFKNWYIGAGYGRANHRDLGNMGYDNKKDAYQAYLGYDFNKNFALEAGYYNLGTVTTPAGDVKSNGELLDAVVSFPFNDYFGVYAKGGANWTQNSGNAVDTGSSNKTRANYGGGLKFTVSDNWALRGEWQRFDIQNNKTDLISLNAEYAFK